MSKAARANLLCISACLLALSGCTSMKVRLGWKVYLDKTPIASIEASLPKGPGMAPGAKSPLVVAVTEPTGKTLLTEGKGGGKVMWKDLQVTASVVTVNQKGVLSLSRDPRVSDGKVGHITVTVPSHPDMKAELDIPFRYDVAFVSNFSGATGSSGMNGTDGSDGAPGSTGSMDPNSPSAGGDGGNGTDGSNGASGASGGESPASSGEGSRCRAQETVLGRSAGGHTVGESGWGRRWFWGKRRPRRARGLRRDRIAQWIERTRRLGWKKRDRWESGERWADHGDVRPAGQDISGYDSSFAPEWARAGVQGRNRGCAVVRWQSGAV